MIVILWIKIILGWVACSLLLWSLSWPSRQLKMRIEYFQIYGKDERNLKWDNLDQIKFNASAQLRSTSTLIQQSGPMARWGSMGQGEFKYFAHAIWIENKKYFHRKDIINCGLVNHTSPMIIWPIGFLLSSFSLNFLLTSFVLNVAVVSKTHFSLRSIKHLLHNSGLLLHHYYVDMLFEQFLILYSALPLRWELRMHIFRG